MPVEQRLIGSLRVSSVGLGCNNFGIRLDQACTDNVVHAALDHGITFFDTSNTYGETQSEVFLGRALGARRASISIASKFGMGLDERFPDIKWSAHPDYVASACEASLRRLGTNHIDLYQLHFPDAMAMMPGLVDDYLNNPTGVLATMRCYPWVRGNNALMGDSAHAVVPFYGQGMNCSFEDCIVLDECIEELGGDWNSVLDAYQKLRKPNADAIANLALQNFVEMRDLVGSDEFLYKKKIEHTLSEKYPDLFVSQYERVTFSTRDYAEALAYGELNDRVLEAIIQNKWEEKLDDRAFVETLFADHQS
ncbi:MAG: hypothetical protein EBR81_17305 [Proteobacteria bacterium]|nr:hypothetical protein [Pseudomonadota bacterium]